MKPTQQQIQELEQFFNDTPPPKVIKVNVATTHNDAPNFVKENIALLKSDEVSAAIAEMRYELLLELKGAILNPVE